MSDPKDGSKLNQADVYAALAAQSSSRRPLPNTSYHWKFPNPSTELITSGTTPNSKVNSRKIYCTKYKCQSLIMLEKAGEVIEIPVDVLPYQVDEPFPTPPAGTTSFTYLYVPTPFQFENIGYSRPDQNTVLPPGTPGLDAARGKVKWLICAECDLGAIGWGFEGSQEAWVDMRRVRYSAEAPTA